MGTFIRRRQPRAHELGLHLTRGEAGVQAAIFAPRGKGTPLRLEGMRPDWAIAAARDLANELGCDVAVLDDAGVWKDFAPEPCAAPTGGRREDRPGVGAEPLPRGLVPRHCVPPGRG